MAHEFRTTRRIEWSDTDTAGIIHFANYFRFMEQVEHEFLRSVGLSCMMELDGQVVTWPRVSATCDFVKPLRFEDVVNVELAVERIGGKSVTYSFRFSKDGDEVARGRLVTACCRKDASGLTGIEIPSAIRAKLEGQCDSEGEKP